MFKAPYRRDYVYPDSFAGHFSKHFNEVDGIHRNQVENHEQTYAI